MIIKPPSRTQPTKWLKFGLNSFMALAYISIGAFLFISRQSSKILPLEYIPFVAWALILYGVFRGFRAYLQFKNPRVF